MVIEVNNLSKIILKNTILKGISMRMESGNIYGLIGTNGSGKTMLMKCLCGLITPTQGEIIIDGKRLGKDMDFPEDVGALIENPGLIGYYNGFDNLKEIASINGKINDNDIVEIMEEVGLNPYDKKKVKKYSLGMKQKLGIAMAVMENPRLLILDEPFNGLDEKSRNMLTNLIHKRKEDNCLIVMSCHERYLMDHLADECFLIEEGSITDRYKVKECD